MNDIINSAKMTCPMCGSPLKNDSSKGKDGVIVKVFHCETCLWSG